MNVKRRRLPNFESCSVALFASLAMGSTTLPARAQANAPSLRSTITSISPSAAPAATLPLARRTRNPAAVAAPAHPAPPTPDGSISSPGFDESLK
jgi:hypothetical protein